MSAVSFPGTLESLAPIGAFTLAAAAAAGLDGHASYRLRLAVDEVATNIIVHGYAEAGLTGMLVLSMHLDPGALTLDIEDTGVPFDVMSVSLPTEEDLTCPLDERAMGGLGLFLITKSVDAFHHESTGLKNRTTLVMYRRRGET
ncbi:ATP-binding protein [Archangium violaceum]|uniref:ATP-binding protein n=1 Tax=Archangium violaceum TaxID=83451 RepID=UPI001950135C|nr:ATP-binding protein [Archangium violaceum]QRN95354.1 ATP-binding protein [Archangium violaceum]